MSIFDAVGRPADQRIHYGYLDVQFGDLRVPAVAPGKLAPLIVFLHGGWWQSEYDLEYAGALCEALKADGIATWSLEYRRVGATGGGWPATFQDVALGLDHVAELAKAYPVDLKRVFAMGHSAGGHLAFWLAGRHHVPEKSVLHEPQPKVVLRGVIGLAAAVDLRLTIDLSGWLTFAHDKREVFSLMGGKPSDFEDRYRAGNPGDLLPLGVKQVLLQGTGDGQIPPQLPGRWAGMARRQGEDVSVTMIAGADHFEIVDPASKAWVQVREEIMKMVRELGSKP
jgi:acetyl esterase/lipase